MNNSNDGNTNSRFLPSPPLTEVEYADSRYKKWNDTISFRWPTSAAKLKNGDVPDNYCVGTKSGDAETYRAHKSDVKL